MGDIGIDIFCNFIERDYGMASRLTLRERSEIFPDGIIESRKIGIRLRTGL